MPEATVYLRVVQPNGKYHFAKPVYSTNRRLKPLYALIQGKPVHHPEGTYYLRFAIQGERKWKSIGNDASMVPVALSKQNHILQGVELGVTEAPAPAALQTGGKHELGASIISYLAEMKEHKSAATWELRDIVLRKHFQKFCKVPYLEDITREDLLGFAAYLKKIGNSPITVRSRVDAIQVFMHHFGLPSLLRGQKLPQYTAKQVKAYSEEALTKMLAIASVDESDLLHFMLCTGARKNEAKYACWTDVDLVRKTYTVTEHLDLGYRPKDKEEGTIPLPDLLVNILKARRLRYPRTRLVFENSQGKPSHKHLKIVKDLAFRAGINCGYCLSKEGKSCADHPVCKQVILHKLRKTYATRLSRMGLPPRMLMKYLRHSSLNTTLKYLEGEDDEQTRSIVNSAFK